MYVYLRVLFVVKPEFLSPKYSSYPWLLIFLFVLRQGLIIALTGLGLCGPGRPQTPSSPPASSCLSPEIGAWDQTHSVLGE